MLSKTEKALILCVAIIGIVVVIVAASFYNYVDEEKKKKEAVEATGYIQIEEGVLYKCPEGHYLYKEDMRESWISVGNDTWVREDGVLVCPECGARLGYA